jgi:hypothetical protein
MDTHEMDQISTCFNLYNSSGIRLLHLHLHKLDPNMMVLDNIWQANDQACCPRCPK